MHALLYYSGAALCAFLLVSLLVFPFTDDKRGWDRAIETVRASSMIVGALAAVTGLLFAVVWFLVNA